MKKFLKTPINMEELSQINRDFKMKIKNSYDPGFDSALGKTV